jgi:hypothetical protein
MTTFLEAFKLAAADAESAEAILGAYVPNNLTVTGSASVSAAR